ncbi:MAG TPA: metallophosphoesterase family protein [Dehalococcoidia bacterium]|nr:metallophosphoesterase family protein [Dehalococcoidia bacterium]
MLIGLISDTHIRIPGHRVSLSTLTAEELPVEVKKAFKGVDLILHAGDIYTLPVLDDLETVAPVISAEGDDDPFESVNDPRVKPEHTIVIEGITIWLSHYGLWPENSTKKLPDVVVYGHSHRSAMETVDGTLRINPGSPTFPLYNHQIGTVGFLDIKDGKVEARIVQLEGMLNDRTTSGIPGITS